MPLNLRDYRPYAPSAVEIATSREVFFAHHLRLAADRNGDCVICLKKYSLKDPSVNIIDCSHTFGRTCLAIWLDEHQTCPLCRRKLFHKRIFSNDYHRIARGIVENFSTPISGITSIVEEALGPHSLQLRSPARYTVLALYSLSIYTSRQMPLPSGVSAEMLTWLMTAAQEASREPQDIATHYDVRYGGVSPRDLENTRNCVRRRDLDEVWRGPGLLPPVYLAEWYDPRPKAHSPIGVDWVLRKERWVSSNELPQRYRGLRERLRDWFERFWYSDLNIMGRLGDVWYFLPRCLDRIVAHYFFVEGIPGP